MNQFEFYETPSAFTRWLFTVMAHWGTPIVGNVFEPCVGSGAIIRAAALREKEFGVPNQWISNDLDPRWSGADYNEDATAERLWCRQGIEAIGGIDWTVTNPPFTPAIDIATHALKYSRVGVALHLRASIHEVLKTGVRRTWMAEHTPTGILWLPRFAYQRSKTTGDWTTDSVCACWVVWLKPSIAVQCGPGHPDFGKAVAKPAPQLIRYAPESVIDELNAETPEYRARMDHLMAERAA